MPYISSERRPGLAKPLNRVLPLTAGELNYAITRLCQDYIIRTGRSYDTYNAVVGVLECARLEFYRRLVAPYEDGKIAENGDVYEG